MADSLLLLARHRGGLLRWLGHGRPSGQAGEAADTGGEEEAADLRRRREERLARHGHVEGEVVVADAAEVDLGGAVALDEPHQLAAGDLEHAAARGAVADGRVGLHRALGAGIGPLELAYDSRPDAQR